jgi:hypothetical protein
VVYFAVGKDYTCSMINPTPDPPGIAWSHSFATPPAPSTEQWPSDVVKVYIGEHLGGLGWMWLVRESGKVTIRSPDGQDDVVPCKDSWHKIEGSPGTKFRLIYARPRYVIRSDADSELRKREGISGVHSKWGHTTDHVFIDAPTPSPDGVEWETEFDKKFVFESDNGHSGGPGMLFKVHPSGKRQIAKPEHVKEFIRAIRPSGNVSGIKALASISPDGVQCRGCGKPLQAEKHPGVADGCPCNSPRGINHGLVPSNVCTCKECDPAQTGSARSLPHQNPDGGEDVFEPGTIAVRERARAWKTKHQANTILNDPFEFAAAFAKSETSRLEGELTTLRRNYERLESAYLIRVRDPNSPPRRPRSRR